MAGPLNGLGASRNDPCLGVEDACLSSGVDVMGDRHESVNEFLSGEAAVEKELKLLKDALLKLSGGGAIRMG